jgi:tetratricopeptide (TPR) repeat protein
MSTLTIPQAMQMAARWHQSGQLAEAETIYRQILAQEPSFSEAKRALGGIALAHHQMGDSLSDGGDWDAACEAYARALSIRPDSVTTYYNMGLALHRLGRLAIAEQACRRALSLNNDHADSHALLGLVLRQMKRSTEAISHDIAALKIRRDWPEVLNNLGNALLDEGRHDEAGAAFTRVIDLQPACAEAHNNLGNVFRAQGRLDEAETAYRRAAQLKPTMLDASSNLATVHMARGNDRLAEDLLRQLIADHPDFAPAHWNLSLILLGRGDYQNGWKEYEWRWGVEDLRLGTRLTSPRWNGENIAGKTLVVHAEQGYGDAIQFARLLPLAAARCGKLIFVCCEELSRLLGSIQGISQTVLAGAGMVPAHDVQCPLLSLPAVLGIDANHFAAGAYIRADNQITRKWAGKLPSDGRKKIGLVWSGKSYPDPFRSMPVFELAALTDIHDVHWISLQTGLAAGSVPEGITLTGCGQELKNFDETAGLLANLDLLISIDTAAAHLAGAMGKPAWVLVKKFPDWRWGREGSACAWYPSVRLFRQQRSGDWSHPMRELADALARGL